MRATVNVGELKKLLAPVLDIAPKKAAIADLEFMRLEVEGGTLRVTAADLDIIMVATLSVADASDGELVVPARQFCKLISATPRDEWVKLSAEKDRLIVDLRDARFSLITIKVKGGGHFAAEWASKPDSAGASLPAGWMQDKLAKVAAFISTEETRYYLNGVCWHTFDQGLALVATDGHRLARITSDIDASALLGNRRFILPRYAVSLLVKHLKAPCVVTFVGDDKQCMRFTAANVSFVTKLIDGTFPDYERVIPSAEVAITVTVNSDRLLAALKRLTAFAGRQAIAIKCTGRKLVAFVKDYDENGGAIALPGDVVGKGEPIALNSSYFKAICQAARGQEIKAEIRGPGEPIKFIEGRDLYIQMPMRGGPTDFVVLPAGAVAA